ncbi:MAG: M1 family aminopeptidase, partial [Elusimicrobiota bacterium]
MLIFLPMALIQGAFLPKNRPYDVSHYHIIVRLDVDSGRFDNTVFIRLTPAESLSEIELDSVGLEIKKVIKQPQDQSLEFRLDREKGLLKIIFSKPEPAGREIEIAIEYSGQAQSGHEGLFKTADPDESGRSILFFTHFESVSARRFFPSNDEPYDKATSETTLETDPGYEALSNGSKVSDEIVDIAGRRVRRVHWRQDKPHSTYLLNIAVGDFTALEDSSHGVPLAVYTSAAKKERARFSMEVLKRAMGFYQNFYGIDYPWARYGMVGVPGFLWGGMENTTLTSMRESAMVLEDPGSQIQKLRIASVVAHELAHQWFGNYVTMKWWDDLWLNEAFASYMETVACEDFFGNEWAVIETVTNAWESYFREEDGPRSHPIVSKDLPTPDDAFDSTTYTKGEQVLRMLDFYIGREALRHGLENYLKRHAFGNATFHDFIEAMEKASGQNLQGFVAGWLLARGYPIIEISERWDNSAKKMLMTVKQRPNHPGETTVFDFKIPMDFHRNAAPAFHERRVLLVNKSQVFLEAPLPAEPEWTTWNAGGAALVKIFRPAPDQSWARQALGDPDPLARIAALFELAKPWVDRDAKAPGPLSPVAKTTLEKALTSDPSPYVRAALLDKFLDSKWARLPGDLAPALLAGAKNPVGLGGQDPIGRTMVQARSLALLGKMGAGLERDYVAQILGDDKANLDLTAAAASGMARFSDEASLAALRQALDVQAKRGYPFRKAVLLAFASVEHASAVLDLLA